MRLSIHTRGLELSDSLRQFADKKTALALERLASHVKHIQLYLFDSNGPHRNGPDKTCRVVIQLHKHRTLVLEDRDSNLGIVIDRITDRLESAVHRRVERLRSKRRTFPMGHSPMQDFESA